MPALVDREASRLRGPLDEAARDRAAACRAWENGFTKVRATSAVSDYEAVKLGSRAGMLARDDADRRIAEFRRAADATPAGSTLENWSKAR